MSDIRSLAADYFVAGFSVFFSSVVFLDFFAFFFSVDAALSLDAAGLSSAKVAIVKLRANRAAINIDSIFFIRVSSLKVVCVNSAWKLPEQMLRE